MTFQSILDEVRNNLNKVLTEMSITGIDFSVEPAKSGFGDVSSNISFLLAKQLKKSPRDIAQLLSENYEISVLDNLSTRKLSSLSIYMSKTKIFFMYMSVIKTGRFFNIIQRLICMKIAFVGGLGFIGSRAVKILSNQGHDVVVMDIRTPESKTDEFSYIHQDVRDYDSLYENLK